MRRLRASVGAVVAVCVLTGCGSGGTKTGGDGAPSGAPRVGTAAMNPERYPGSGRLRDTRFAVLPIVTVKRCVARRHPCVGAAYTVYARLNRDVPRRANGAIAARF